MEAFRNTTLMQDTRFTQLLTMVRTGRVLARCKRIPAIRRQRRSQAFSSLAIIVWISAGIVIKDGLAFSGSGRVLALNPHQFVHYRWLCLLHTSSSSLSFCVALPPFCAA